MHKLTTFLFNFFAGCFFAASQTTSPYVISSGGGFDVNGGHTVSWTLGQPATQTLVNGSNLLTQGFQQPNEKISISGKIATATGTTVSTVTVSVTGSEIQTDITANDGLYGFNVKGGGNFTVTPSKSNDVTTNNGVTTLDIILMQRHILTIQSLNSPYKTIAADVNASSTVSTLDIVLMRAVILTNSPTFPNGKLWAFVRSDHTFQNPQVPFPFESFRSYSSINEDKANQNFIAIKLGDVNDSWDPNVPKTGASGEVRMMMIEHTVLPDEVVIVPVKVRDFKNITGYQFTLSWDSVVLSLEDVIGKSILGYYGMQKIEEGYLTTSWYDDMAKDITLKDDETVFELKFKAIGSEGSFSEIKIGSELTVSEAYNANLDLLNVIPQNGVVKVGNAGSFIIRHSSFVNLLVQPNPFSRSAGIIFSIPKDETVIIEIYDLTGRAIKHFKSDYKAGEHRLAWSGDNDEGKLLSRGLYHVRMVAGDYTNSKKAVLIR